MERYYVGVDRSGRAKVFQTSKRVTRESFPWYEFVIGPFDDHDTALKYALQRYDVGKLPKRFMLENPGARAHRELAERYYSTASKYRLGTKTQQYLRGKGDAHRESAEESDRLGLPNPRRRRTRIKVGDRVASPRYPGETGRVLGIEGDRAFVEWSESGAEHVNLSRLTKRNPSANGATVVYDRILAIEAEKGKDSLWPRERFRHDFTSGAKVIGEADGSLRVVPEKGKKLWRRFRYD